MLIQHRVLLDPLLKEGDDLGLDALGLVVAAAIVTRLLGTGLGLHGRLLQSLQHLRADTGVVSQMHTTQDRQLAVGREERAQMLQLLFVEVHASIALALRVPAVEQALLGAELLLAPYSITNLTLQASLTYTRGETHLEEEMMSEPSTRR